MSLKNPLNFPKSSESKDWTGSVNRLYEFGPFRLDPEKRILEKRGVPVPLGSRAFDLLLALVEESGRTVDKDELMKRLWPDSFVEEGNLSVQVSALRKALGEAPDEHEYIVTIPGRGYRFAKPIRALEKGRDFVRREGDHPDKTKWLNKRTGLAIALVLFAGVAMWLYMSLGHKAKTLPPRVIPLTSFLGFELYPALSPDGNQLAFAWDGEKRDNFDIYVQQIGVGGEPLRLTQNAGADICPAWSPDGKFLYYTKNYSARPIIPGLWRMPVQGGEEVLAIETLDPELWGYLDVVEKGIYFVEATYNKLHWARPAVLKFMNFATGRIKEITPIEKPPMFGNQGLSASPDGRWVLYQDYEVQGADILLVENFK